MAGRQPGLPAWCHRLIEKTCYGMAVFFVAAIAYSLTWSSVHFWFKVRNTVGFTFLAIAFLFAGRSRRRMAARIELEKRPEDWAGSKPGDSAEK